MLKLPIVGAAYKFPQLTVDCQNSINWYPQAIEIPNGDRVAALMPTAGLVRMYQGDDAAVRCLKVLSNGDLLVIIAKKLYHSPANKFQLTQITGTISGTDIVSIADNGIVAMIVNGSTIQILNLSTLVLTKLTGSNIPRSSFVAFLDGRFVLNKVKTGRFVWTDLYSTNIDPLSYATAEASPDPMVALIEFQRELWMFGKQTVERYYSNNDLNAPYVRLPGGVIQIGCDAPFSVCKFATGVIWLAVSEFGGNQIVMSAGGAPTRISNHAIEAEISSYSTTTDAIAYAYQNNGHAFYVISFPSGNTTFVFDGTTQLWHQRSWTNSFGQHERHRGQVHAYFNGVHLLGDHQNGRIYDLNVNAADDDGDIVTRERTCSATLTDGVLTRFNRFELVSEALRQDSYVTGLGAYRIVSTEPVTFDGAVWLFPYFYIQKSGTVGVNDGAGREPSLMTDWEGGNKASKTLLLNALNQYLNPYDLICNLIEDDYLEIISKQPFFYDADDYDGSLPIGEHFTPLGDAPYSNMQPIKIELNNDIDAKIMLTWSDDRGHTWSNNRIIELGKVGQYAKRVETRRLGSGRDRVFRVRCTDPVALSIVEARLS